ncbi:MAG: DNA replication/repair protein RecF [Actinobacteria bacterium]|nr:DNA replication/repair protein RecF [Actinomycetota bacterium]
MHLKKLELKNYRNYKHIKLDFENRAVLLAGNNGNGKTNLLESIYYLSSGKSHRTNLEDELINWDADFCLLRAVIGSPGGDNDDFLLEIEMRRQNRAKIRVNKVYVQKKTDFIYILPSVIFSPDDLRIIKSSPSQRRDFLDSILEKIEKGYSRLRLQYNKVLLQRNGLIKSISGRITASHMSTLEVWNENLIKYGSEIIERRLALAGRLKGIFGSHIEDFFNGTSADMKYIFSWDRQENNGFNSESGNTVIVKPAHMDGDGQLYGGIRKIFESRLAGNQERDLSYRTTTTGPHRDDLAIFFDGKDVRSFGSQGQQRIAAVSLKLCELQILKEDLGKNPILLLDDVLSELDIERRKKLIHIINDCYQTFVTATNVSYLDNLDVDFNRKYLIRNNAVTQLDY